MSNQHPSIGSADNTADNTSSRKALRIAVKVLFACSAMIMSVLLSLFNLMPSSALSLDLFAITTFSALGIVLFLVIKCKFIERTFSNLNIPLLVLSAALTYFPCHAAAVELTDRMSRLFVIREVFVGEIITHFWGENAALVSSILSAGALFAAFVFTYCFVNAFVRFIRDLYEKSDKADKIFFFAALFVSVAAISLVYSHTTAFYSGVDANGGVRLYDIIYTTDSGEIFDSNAYYSINAEQNDIRQPLFGLFAAPFGSLAKLISLIFFFVPNIYPIALAAIQAGLLLLAVIMTAEMMKLRGLLKAAFFALYALSFPMLIYVLTMEQYIFSMFWLIMFIYCALSNRQERQYAFAAASSSMLTTGVLFPLLSDKRSFWGFVKDIFEAGVKFASFIILFGQLALVANFMEEIGKLMRFSGVELTFGDKLLQFFSFVSSCFFAPAASTADTLGYMSYFPDAVTSVSAAGVVLLALVLLGFALNMKNKFAQICMAWTVFSFVILCVVGWGTQENGLVLYALYFSWAYISLIFMLFEKVGSYIKNKKAAAVYSVVKYAVFISFALLMLWVNIPEMANILRFGAEYYPA
ncbi:MAG: hypothetical protein LBL82_03220 [Oscillospiraceae bacterium]|jgi:hypothetical protein|nr:hypothetical protein [Oscillospiraceae bacterium]